MEKTTSMVPAKPSTEPQQSLATRDAASDELPLDPRHARRLGLNLKTDAEKAAANRANFKATVGALKGDLRERLICYRLAECDDIIEKPEEHDPVEVRAARKYVARNTK